MSGRVGSITTEIITDGLVFNMDAANRASTIPISTVTTSFNTVNLSQSGSFSDNGIFDSSTITPSFAFGGTDDYINCGDHANLSFGNGTNDLPFSVGAWVKITDTNINRIVCKSSNLGGSVKGEWVFSTGTGARVALLWLSSEGAGSSGPYQIGVGSTSLSSHLNTWVYLAATYDGGGGATAANGIKVYFNGVLESMSTLTSGTYVAMENTVSPLVIAADPGYSSNYYSGNIGPIHIYNRALSAKEIRHNYNALKGRFGL